LDTSTAGIFNVLFSTHERRPFTEAGTFTVSVNHAKRFTETVAERSAGSRYDNALAEILEELYTKPSDPPPRTLAVV